MPNGNIGTSLTTFMRLIRTCRLPPHVIKKLGLSFPCSRSKHRYGSVKFDYGNDTNKGGISLCPEDSAQRNVMEENVESEDIPLERMSTECNSLSSNQQDIVSDSANYSDRLNTNESSSKIAPDDKQDSNQPNIDADDNELSSDTESEPEEDWERHEALHDDVDCQGRTKERLFENKIELKWEKGGSGLVFYTDAAYWDSLNGDFDEQTADDWDIDMSIYEKGGRSCYQSSAMSRRSVVNSPNSVPKKLSNIQRECLANVFRHSFYS